MALKVPNGPTPKTVKYTDLLGCDFSQDSSLVDRRHSPDMLNMISDEGGNPVKRKGWESLVTEGDASHNQIQNLWVFETGGTEYLIAEINVFGTQSDPLYVYNYFAYYDKDANAFVTIANSTVNQAGSSLGFFYKTGTTEGLYLYNISGVYRIRSENGSLVFENITDTAFVPTTLISRQPSGGKGGTAYQEVNLLTRKRTESFLTKSADYDESSTTTYKTQGTINPTFGAVYEYMNAQGEWVTGTATITDTHTITVSPAAGAPPSEGTDNVRITYTADGVPDKAVIASKNVAFYSQGSSEHVFLTGSSLNKQRVWWSAIGDPTYFPDINYIDLRNDSGECMCFLPVGNELAVVKNEQKNNHSNIYLIYDKSITSTSVSSVAEDGTNTTKTTQEYTYAVKRIASANGAVSHNGFAVLGDEPLFLSSQGLFGIVSTNTSENRVVRNRSRFVDRKLTAERNLDKAQMLVDKDYLYVFVKDHVYVFDARHKTGDERNNTNYMYEAYYWENVPVDHVCTYDGTIYFATKNKLCRFKNTGEITDYSDDGTAIHAVWSTRNDDDNAPQMFKTMMKKGTMCTLAPYDRSSVHAYVIADGEERFEIGTFYVHRQDLFVDVDFTRFTFDTGTGPRDYFFRKKKKKYIRLQLFFENNEVDEGFGLFGIVKTYTEIRYAK